MKFDEYFFLQLVLAMNKHQISNYKGKKFINLGDYAINMYILESLIFLLLYNEILFREIAIVNINTLAKRLGEDQNFHRGKFSLKFTEEFPTRNSVSGLLTARILVHRGGFHRALGQGVMIIGAIHN